MKKETANEYADRIEKQLERLNRLEESLLMLSKIDAGTLLLKHEKVDLYTALNLAGLSIVIIHAILFMQKFGYGTMGLVLIWRIYRIFLNAFIVADVR